MVDATAGLKIRMNDATFNEFCDFGDSIAQWELFGAKISSVTDEATIDIYLPTGWEMGNLSDGFWELKRSTDD